MSGVEKPAGEILVKQVVIFKKNGHYLSVRHRSSLSLLVLRGI